MKLYTISRVYGIRHIAFPDKFEVIANYERQQLEHSRASARILLKFLSLYSNYSKRYSEERLKYNLNPCLDPLSSIIEPLSFLFFSLFLFFSFFLSIPSSVARSRVNRYQRGRCTGSSDGENETGRKGHGVEGRGVRVVFEGDVSFVGSRFHPPPLHPQVPKHNLRPSGPSLSHPSLPPSTTR